jgi:hypothetical protein
LIEDSLLHKNLIMQRYILLFCLWGVTSFLSAQDYHHYWVSWVANGKSYGGVMAVNTRLPTQVLRLTFFDDRIGGYRLIEQRYTLSYHDGYNYLHNHQLSDRTFCDNRRAYSYSPDQFYFIEDGYELQMWCIDGQGVTAKVYSEFISLQEIDGFKPYFWPEKYGHCNSTYWNGLMFALFNQ